MLTTNGAARVVNRIVEKFPRAKFESIDSERAEFVAVLGPWRYATRGNADGTFTARRVLDRQHANDAHAKWVSGVLNGAARDEAGNLIAFGFDSAALSAIVENRGRE